MSWSSCSSATTTTERFRFYVNGSGWSVPDWRKPCLCTPVAMTSCSSCSNTQCPSCWPRQGQEKAPRSCSISLTRKWLTRAPSSATSPAKWRPFPWQPTWPKHNDTKDIVQARSFLNDVIKGDAFDCNAAPALRQLIMSAGRKMLKEAEKVMSAYVCVDDRKWTVSIHGSSMACTKGE